MRQAELAYMRVATWIPETFPQFMCIGAPRAATTWLHKRLSSDHRIFLPKRKEMHFYDERPPHGTNIRSGLRWHNTHFFDVDDEAHLRWYWFQYRHAGGRLRGDITPLYSLLSEARVQSVRTHMPDLRIIYILRNPVDRAWSGLRKTIWYQKGSNQLSAMDESWLEKMIMQPGVLSRGDYRRAIETWESVFPTEQICYLFYDDIRADSTAVLDHVYHFLGLDPQTSNGTATDSNPVNAAPKRDMPESIRLMLEDHYAAQVRFLEERFSRDLSHWIVS